LIVNLYKLNLRELFEILYERLGNGVQRAVRLTTAREVDVRDTISKDKFAVAGKTIQHKRKPLIALDIAGSLEELVQHRADQISRR